MQARGLLRGNVDADPSRPSVVYLPFIRDWILDHEGTGSIWLVTDSAWYK